MIKNKLIYYFITKVMRILIKKQKYKLASYCLAIRKEFK